MYSGYRYFITYVICANVLCQSMDFLFIFFIVSFGEKKVLILMKFS